MTSTKLPVDGPGSVEKGVRTYVRKSIIMFFVLPQLLFWPAGSWTWVNGWLFVGFYVVNTVLTIALLLPRCPALLAERATRHAGMKKWDLVLTSIAAVYLPLVSWILAALDHRYGWSGSIPVAQQALGFVLASLGSGIVLWAMLTNAFFSAVIRIQSDRGHQVITDGPYRYVRHPGYVGWILANVGTPLMLSSYWAYAPLMAALVLVFIRTYLEDRTLHRELSGYDAYAKQTRYRLCPGIW